jgi:hypothetical protein
MFAGFYYSLYNKGKTYEISSIVSGLGSGVIATAITHPFEIIRAKLQTDLILLQKENNLVKISIFNQLK